MARPPDLPADAAWARRILAELDESDSIAERLVRGLTLAQLNWKPSGKAWSVGQCVQHLCVANDVYLRPIANALDGRPQSPVQAITPGWFGRWFIRSYIDPATQRRKASAPRKIAPTQQIEPSVIDVFIRSNIFARALVRRAAAYDVNRIRFVNPFVPGVRFTVGTGLEIIWRHQRRHLRQAERVLNDPAFPRAVS